MKLDVCVFTHNPRRDVFQIVVEAIGRQTCARERFHTWIVDNASAPPITDAELKPLARGGVRHTILREDRLGLLFGRFRAIEATSCEWVVFVDDDNELAPDYLEHAAAVASANPHFGAFGGKLLLPDSLKPAVPKWIEPLLPYLAVHDHGDERFSACLPHWDKCQPAGAGAVVRRSVLLRFANRLQQISKDIQLGRRGKKGLASCEDGVLMRGCHPLGLHCAYEPSLRLNHHIHPGRLNFRYLFRLFYHYGRSHVVLERCLGNPVAPLPDSQRWKIIARIPNNRERVLRMAWEYGHFVESRVPDAFTLPP